MYNLFWQGQRFDSWIRNQSLMGVDVVSSLGAAIYQRFYCGKWKLHTIRSVVISPIKEYYVNEIFRNQFPWSVTDWKMWYIAKITKIPEWLTSLLILSNSYADHQISKWNKVTNTSQKISIVSEVNPLWMPWVTTRPKAILWIQ